MLLYCSVVVVVFLVIEELGFNLVAQCSVVVVVFLVIEELGFNLLALLFSCCCCFFSD